ncbi:MAG: hypothetical protein M3R29_06230, partial [Verrucomicrobiota bacterium]|nr:hypothetical protein [Verrucomicrobiota bacterium]
CGTALPLQHRIYSYIDRGFYAHQVHRLFEIFGRDKCFVLLNEDLRTDHLVTVKKVFEFLNVDSSVTPKQASVFEHDYDEAMDPELHARLIDIFYFDIKELERMLKRDLSAWTAR